MALVLVAGLVTLCFLASEPTDVEVSVEAPSEVNHGDRFVVQAQVRNTADRRQVLVDLDLADTYLEGIAIERAEPPFSDARHVPIDNTVSYSFDIPIGPGEETTVSFYAYAAHVGDYQGRIDFCINSEIRCITYRLRTIVREANR